MDPDHQPFWTSNACCTVGKELVPIRKAMALRVSTSRLVLSKTCLGATHLATCSRQTAWHAGDSSGRRFMAYNALGCVICKEGDEHNVIEVALHDTRAQRRRMPNLNDLYRFSIASLGDRVSVVRLP